MQDRLFYIGGEWLTYEQAHRLGYTILPPKILTLYTQDYSPKRVRKDIATNQFYDADNLEWIDDFYDLGLFLFIETTECYTGERKLYYNGYTDHSNSNTVSHILFDGTITDLNHLYLHNGITLYKCANTILDDTDNPVVWYDSKTNKYFDNRDGRHYWVDNISDTKVEMFNSISSIGKCIYEDTENECFYDGQSLISYDDFYSYNFNGIIREVKHAYYSLDPSTVVDCYYDSYSDEYCIPNVTLEWVPTVALESLGWVIFDDYAEFWLCQTPLYLLWKYKASTATLSFVNTLHPELDIDLPDPIISEVGSSILLPSMSGVYEDSLHHKYTPTSWNIGEFGSTFVLTNDTAANLILDAVTATVSFTNTMFHEADIDLPDSITVNTGETIRLPVVFGSYKDSNDIKWTASSWSEGNFDSVYTVTDDISIDLVWEQIATYNVVDDSGVIVHSGQSVIYTAPVNVYVQDQPLITYGNIDSIVCDSHELVYARIDPVIQTAPHLIISSSEAIPPADLVIYNEDTGEISSSIFKKNVVTFSTSHLIVGNPNTEIIFGDTSLITLDNALEDIVIAQTDHITTNDSDLQTVLVAELPTVSTSGDFGDYNILTANTSGGSTTLSPSDSWVPYIGGTTNTANYNNSFTYATVVAYDSNLNEVDRTSLGYFNTNPNLGWKNIGTSSIEVRQAKVAVCHSNNVEVVTVYNTSGTAYNAFKYTEDDTDYYYVIDEIHASWTDDLASIGYSNVYLPRVFSYTGTQTSSSISPGASFDTELAWDASKLYIGETNDGQGNITRYGWKAEENEPLPHVFSYTNTQTTTSVAAGESFDTGLEWDSSKLYIGETNDGHGNVTRYGWEVEEGEPVSVQTAFPNVANNSQSLPMVGDGVVYTYTLFDENGNWLSASNDYVLVGYHETVSGPLLSLEGTGVYLLKDTMYGRMKITSNGAMRVSIQCIEYTVS